MKSKLILMVVFLVSFNLLATDQKAMKLSISPSLTFSDYGVGQGSSVALQFETYKNLFIGFETGFYWWQRSYSGNGSSGNSAMWVIPFLISTNYRFDYGESLLHPYLGFAIGTNLTLLRKFYLDPINTEPVSNPELLFSALIKPGLDFDVTKNFSISAEPKIGFFSNQFIFLPSIGFNFFFR